MTVPINISNVFLLIAFLPPQTTADDGSRIDLGVITKSLPQSAGQDATGAALR